MSGWSGGFGDETDGKTIETRGSHSILWLMLFVGFVVNLALFNHFGRNDSPKNAQMIPSPVSIAGHEILTVTETGCQYLIDDGAAYPIRFGSEANPICEKSDVR